MPSPRGRQHADRRTTGPLPVTAMVGALLLTGAYTTGSTAESGGRESPAPTGATRGEPTADASAVRCTRDRLSLSVGRLSAGAGNRYLPLVFTNTGSESCSLRGHPGVTLLDASGERIGEPAEREGRVFPAVTLEPDASAYASLHTVADGVTDAPCQPPATTVQAYPPGSTWALRAPVRSFQVCGDVFEVSAVRPGEHP
ncbi:DUF4232 domain-containing protein [Streptomyces sp. AS58]|uniref:DUF4232 domain-containing protein n=1 Tax=Streptomyces sp. AS58 TaxID=1519489 RepID=UPI0006AEDA56|nr:DUF4232 domain-containing protein [Streptomyces sp. AS58]